VCVCSRQLLPLLFLSQDLLQVRLHAVCKLPESDESHWVLKTQTHTHIAEMPGNKRARTQTRRCKLGMLCGAHVRRVLRRSITGASQLIYYIEPRESEACVARGGNINLQQLKLQPWRGQQLTLCTRFCLCVCAC
jgi:hypothetical protein